MIKLYLDGVEVGATPLTGNVDQDNSVPVAVGSQPGGGKYFDGKIDDVRIMQRGLTKAEVLTVAGGETPTEEETPPVEEEPPIGEAGPVEETPPVEESPPPVEVVNLAPDITDTSYSCDPVVESVAFTVGQTDYFTLSVTDESPLTLTYSFDSSREGIVSVEVDNNGVFTISALQAGDVFLWLSATDDQGLVDEYELRVVVE